MENKEIPTPLLEIFLLGRFQVKIDGVPIDEKRWTRRSAKSLIKLLALKPFHSLHREQIMDLLWAEESPETALNNLNKAIYGARRAFEPDLTKGSASKYILSSENQIILGSPGTLSIDLDEFERLANFALQNNDLAAGSKAIELYLGDLLTDDPYEDWIYMRRESQRILFRKTATKTAEFYATRGKHQAGIEILKKLIAEDATDEYVHRLLMRYYAETGSKYQALKQFEQCRNALKNTLDIEPEPETTQLEQSIKRGAISRSTNGHKLAVEKPAETVISTPRITPLTFQDEVIKSAKFLPGGESIILSAAWEDNNLGLYKMDLKTNETRRLGIKYAEILSVSPDGEMAIALKSLLWDKFNTPGTLATMGLSDEKPRKILENIQWSDWHPSKSLESTTPSENFLAVVRDRKGRNCLEFPIDNVIFETGGWISHPQFSADGKKIAFIEHPIANDDEGFVVLLDLEDKTLSKQILTVNWLTIFCLAWYRDEIWFTASNEAKTRTINAVNLKGEERLIYRGLGRLKLHDSYENRMALVSDHKTRCHISVFRAEEGVERDVTWHDFTTCRDITDDGKTILIEEGGISSGIPYLSYVRQIDGKSTKLIGSGAPIALSPDAKYALVRIPVPDNHLSLINIDTRETTDLKTDPENSLLYQEFACFFPDGKRVLFSAAKLDSGTRIYTQEIDGGHPVCLTPDEEGISIESHRSISADGKYIIVKNVENRLSLYRVSDGTISLLKDLDEDFSLLRWTADNKSLFIRRRGNIPAVVYKYDIESGKTEKFLDLMPKDTTGVIDIISIKLTPDGKTYAYSYMRQSSDLYLMEGLA